MYIVTSNITDEINSIGATLERWSNGYPIVSGVAFPTGTVNIYEVSEVPTNVEPTKWCYTEADGFYENPNYTEPNKYMLDDDLYNRIIDDYTMTLIEEGVIE